MILGKAVFASGLVLTALGLSAAAQTVGPPTPFRSRVEGRQEGSCGLRGVDIVAERKSVREAILFAHTDGVLRATVTLSLVLDNAVSSERAPLTVDVEGGAPTELVRLRQKNLLGPWSSEWSHVWRHGGRGGVHEAGHVYTLPWDRELAFQVVQGRMGTQTHGGEAGAENALDFGLPLGTTVRAARKGRVIARRDDSDLGGPDRRLAACANFVMILHSDGTYGGYYHLAPRSVRVSMGQEVAVGEALAASGATGFALGPHLHFEVFRNLDATRYETFPAMFETSEGVLRDLKEGLVYMRP